MSSNGRDLFQVVPNGFFGPLVAPGAAIYARILLALFGEWERHVQPISRETALYCIASILGDPMAMHLTEDAMDGDASENAEEDQVQGRAAAILRYLTQRGWLRPETQADFAQMLIFPSYAAHILTALGEIGGEQMPSEGLIYPIYDTLRSILEKGEADVRLGQAHRQTRHLLIELRELRDNIGTYLDRILNQMLPRDVLAEMLTEYHAAIQSSLFHYLHTTEHVSRYRPEIMEVLHEIERSRQLDDAAQKLYERREFPSAAAARDRIYEQAREIREQFQSLDQLLEAIDLRHSTFVDAAVRSIELHLTSHSTTSGQLNEILEHMLHGKTLSQRQLADTADRLIQLYQLAWVGPESLAQPLHAHQPFMPEPEPEEVVTPEELERARRELRLQMQQRITEERVADMVRQLLNGRDEVSSAEIPLASPEDLPLVIFVREFGKRGDADYKVEEEPDAPWIEMNGVGFREFRIKALDKLE